MKITIYKLIDPRNNNVFYIGATKMPIINRLKQHVYKAPHYDREGVCKDRSDLILDIIKSGNYPLIKSIKIVDYDDCHKYECKYYYAYIRRGHKLLQSENSFSYNRKYNTIKNGRKGVQRFNFDLSIKSVKSAKIISSKEGLTLSEKIDQLLCDYINKKESNKKKK